MKKVLSALMITVILFSTMLFPVYADNGEISVYLDDAKIAFDVQPQLINSRTMVPLRAIFEALGATVNWNNDTQTVTSTKGGTTISLTINNPTMYVNGVAITLDSSACLVGGRTLVPVRAVSEAFGTKVDWDGNTSSVYIATNTSKFNKVSSYLKNNGTYIDEHYGIKGENILLSYAEKENLINLSQIEEGMYEVALIISENGDVAYKYIDKKANVQMEGIFTATTLTDDRNNLPYFSYNGSNQIESLVNEQATHAIKMAVMTSDIVLYSNNSNCSIVDLGFAAISNLSMDKVEHSSSNVTIPMYNKFPMVPDWGFVLGDKLIEELEYEGGCIYVYTVEKESKEFLVYKDAIEKSGYIVQNTQFSETIDGVTWHGLVWRHNNESYPWVGFLMSDKEKPLKTIVLINYADDNEIDKRAQKIKERIDETNDAIKDIKSDIESYKLDIERYKKEISNIENDLYEPLHNALMERNVRVFKNGRWVMEADSRLIQSAEQYIRDKRDEVNEVILELEQEMELYEDLLDESKSTLRELEDFKNELNDELKSLKFIAKCQRNNALRY